MMDSVFTWTDFYQELADKILSYKSDRGSLLKLVEKSYRDAGQEYKLFWDNHFFTDIDPFTFYGTFNKGLSEKNRLELIRQYKKNFEIKADLPSEFTGIPVLNNMKAWFMADEQGEQMETYWNLLEAAIKYADGDVSKEGRVIDLFDKAVTFEGTYWNLTMALYWIRPFAFINLDNNNRKKLKNDGIFDGQFPSGKEYIELCVDLRSKMDTDEFPYSSFPEFSLQSWTASSPEKLSNASFLKWFEPLVKALRDLGGSATPQEARKKIIENEHLTKEDISETRGKSNVNKFENEVAWARNYLVNGGYIDNAVKGIWALTEAGKSVDMTYELASSIFLTGIKGNRKKKGDSTEDTILGDRNIDKVRYWLYSPGQNAENWEEFYKEGIMGIGWDKIGDLSAYDSKEAMKQAMKAKIDPTRPYTMAAHATWQFANEMNIGDVVFAKKGRNSVVGRGVIESDYEYDPKRAELKNIRKVKWTNIGEWPHPGPAALKTLTEVTAYKDYVEQLNALFDIESVDDEGNEVDYPVYDADMFLNEVYMEEKQYDMLVALIQEKKNVILQGAPGVGKTFAAKRLAYSMMGVMDSKRVMMVQFHQSYSYEDFIMGFRPTENGFTLKRGAFYEFCKAAEIDSDNDYFFIIDEINRGNLSKIFGELFMLIENDKRGVELKLLYADEMFSVPKNVYIIGMMNTADRSLAMMDYALRRRFAFYEMNPGFNTEGFKKYRENLNNTKFDSLISCVERLNEVISADESLGEGFCVGHSYFCNLKEVTDHTLSRIVEFELIPLLKEYWFDEPVRAKDWINNLRSSIK